MMLASWLKQTPREAIQGCGSAGELRALNIIQRVPIRDLANHHGQKVKMSMQYCSSMHRVQSLFVHKRCFPILVIIEVVWEGWE